MQKRTFNVLETLHYKSSVLVCVGLLYSAKSVLYILKLLLLKYLTEMFWIAALWNYAEHVIEIKVRNTAI